MGHDWTRNAEGKLWCAEHRSEFSVGRVCPSCPIGDAVAIAAVAELGDYELIEVEARRRKLPSILDLEEACLRSLAQVDRLRSMCVRRAKLCLTPEPAKGNEDEFVLDPDREEHGRSWLSSATKNGELHGKILRGLVAMSHARHERALVERDDRKLKPLTDARKARRGGLRAV